MKPARSGKTLIEAVVILTILTVVVGMSTTSLATLFRIKLQFSRDAEQAQSLSRLAMRMRADAHDAASAAIAEGCTLTQDDGQTVTYVEEGPNLVRQVHRDDAIVHRDTFRLPKNATVRFEREGDSPKSLVRLTIAKSEAPKFTRDLPRTATIEVAVGLNRQLRQTARQP